MGLKGMFQEAVAGDNAALERILKEYEAILDDDPTNTVGLSLHLICCAW